MKNIIVVLTLLYATSAYAKCADGWSDPDGKGCLPNGSTPCGKGYCRSGMFCQDPENQVCEHTSVFDPVPEGPVCPGRSYHCPTGSLCYGNNCYNPSIAKICPDGVLRPLSDACQ
jgi:hypothetical protein